MSYVENCLIDDSKNQINQQTKSTSNYYCSTEKSRCKLNLNFVAEKITAAIPGCRNGQYPFATTMFKVTLQRTADNGSQTLRDIAP